MEKFKLPKKSLYIAILSILLFSCNQNEEEFETENYVVTIEHLDASSIEETISESEEKNFIRRLFGSPSEKNWLKIHRQCMARQTTKNLVFLGVSNRLGLGTIYQKGFTSARDEITKDNFSEDEIKSLINKGASGSCDFQQQVSVDVDVLMDVNSSSFSAIDGELGLAMSNTKDMTATIEGYQINNLYTGRLIKLLEKTQNQEQLDYFDWFKEKGNLLMTSVVQINGFSMVIELKNSIGVDLKAKLEEGLVGNLGDTDIKVKFKYESETKIKMISETDFYVFGEVAKIKKIRKK